MFLVFGIQLLLFFFTSFLFFMSVFVNSVFKIQNLLVGFLCYDEVNIRVSLEPYF